LAQAPFKHGRKLCVFCGNPANSGEHIWPKWAHELIPEVSGHKQVVFEGPVTRDVMSRVYDRDRQGSVAKVAIRRVCNTCNNGWMSEYESKAKAMLTAMMMGRNLALGVDSQRLLGEYFTLKLMVLDWTAADPIFSQEERTAFLDGRCIPVGIKLNIAFCPDHRMSSYYRTHFQEASDVNRLAEHLPGRNVKTFAVGFGGIFLFALCIKNDAADLKLEPRQGWFQLLPAKLPLVYWPPFLAISRDEAETVASSLGALTEHARVKVADDVVGAISKIIGG